jgi:hemerythrin-like domain-containing protein
MAEPSEAVDPFERLTNTHRRIEERLAELEHAAGQADLSTMADVLGFFDRAGARHHEDEERSLFPRLRGDAHIAPLLTALEAEHREHDDARAALQAAHAEGAHAVGPAVERFCSLYRAHIEREEKELFPAARAALDDGAKREMAKEMEDRRGGGGGGRGRRR